MKFHLSFFLFSILSLNAHAWDKCTGQVQHPEAEIVFQSDLDLYRSPGFFSVFLYPANLAEAKTLRFSTLKIEDETSRTYLDTAKSFKLEIDIKNCFMENHQEKCPAQASMLISNQSETVDLTCQLNIPYTPASGSGGRCGGRRC